MGLFDKVDSRYNKALEHYQKAKAVLPNSKAYFGEMRLASELLKEDIKVNRGTADALVVLANIYFALYTWVRSSGYSTPIDTDEYLGYAAALMYHWKTGFRGYNKNTGQAHQVMEMIGTNFKRNNPNQVRTQADIDMLFKLCHEEFYDKVLTTTINL